MRPTRKDDKGNKPDKGWQRWQPHIGKTFVTKTWDRISLSHDPVVEYIPWYTRSIVWSRHENLHHRGSCKNMPKMLVSYIAAYRKSKCLQSLSRLSVWGLWHPQGQEWQILIGMFSFHWRNNNKNATVDTGLHGFGVSRHILSGIGDEINGPTYSNICWRHA